MHTTDMRHPDSTPARAASAAHRGPTDPDVRLVLESITGVPATEGNSIDVLRNGDAIFPAMLEAIEQAEEFIEFLTFVYWQGDIAVRFADALSARARAGVEVRVLLDAYGAHPMDDGLLAEMRAAGCRVAWFRPVVSWKVWRIDSRTHRKLLICDDVVGFTGGVGIAEEWTGDARGPDEWRDTHFEVRGPAVHGLRAAFFDNWVEACGALDLDFAALRPAERQEQDAAIQVVRSCDSVGWTQVAMVLQTMLTLARDHIRLATAYFVPDDNCIELLCDAVARGVRVQVLVPGPHADQRVCQLAGQAVFSRLLDAGVEIWRYQPSMLHIKALVVDGAVACVGSANFNHRSMRQDDEICLLAHHAPTARKLADDFDADLERSERIAPGAWQARPLTQRVKEWFSRRFRRHL